MPKWGTANAVILRVRGYQHMANVLEELDKVTIAVVDGYAVGGGLEVTMACDFVLAASCARWGMPEVDVGITPGWGGKSGTWDTRRSLARDFGADGPVTTD